LKERGGEKPRGDISRGGEEERKKEEEDKYKCTHHLPSMFNACVDHGE
jgi:hypothetical protein